MSLIEVRDLGKTYFGEKISTSVLFDISFSIEKGQFVSIMGHSGSGKSTLLHILGFLDKPTKGKYEFNGRSIDEYKEEELAKVRNSKMGFVFQSFNLLARTTVLDNVKLPLAYSDIKESLWDEKAKKVIDEVGLSHRIDYETSQLSGGERQRVAIARALVNEPSVIFADEPTGNLDSKSGLQIMEIVDSLHEKGHTIILITHEKYIADYAERIIRIKDGRIESDEMVSNRNIHKHKEK